MIQMRSALYSPIADIQGNNIDPTSGPREEWKSLIGRALNRWFSFWEMMRSNTPPEQWEASGMFKNSYNIWRVARLLNEKQEVVSQLRHLDVPCLDKLAELKLLLSSEE